MIYIFLLTIIFSIVSVFSVVLMGSRDLISGSIDLSRILAIFFHWKFLLGAFFAFLARVLFLLINNGLYNIPSLSQSSTTITALITSVSTVAIIIANHYFLGERLNSTQGIGAFLIIIGIAIITIK